MHVPLWLTLRGILLHSPTSLGSHMGSQAQGQDISVCEPIRTRDRKLQPLMAGSKSIFTTIFWHHGSP